MIQDWNAYFNLELHTSPESLYMTVRRHGRNREGYYGCIENNNGVWRQRRAVGYES